MAIYCIRDGTQHPDTAKYCMECGQPLRGEGVNQTPRQPSVLFDESVYQVRLLMGTDAYLGFEDNRSDSVAQPGGVRISTSALTIKGLVENRTPQSENRTLPEEVKGVKNPHDKTLSHGMFSGVPKTPLYGLMIERRKRSRIVIYCQDQAQRDRLATAVEMFLG